MPTSAPLWNVAKMPQITCEAAAIQKLCASPRTKNPTPPPASPMITEVRRLIVSATIPVGVSNRR